MKKVASLSIKSLGYTAKTLRKIVDENAGQATFIGRMTGVAVEMFQGESSNGDYVGFRGSFAAINKEGEIQEASTAFFPSSISNRLKEVLSNGTTEVEINADIYVSENEKSASGYAYVCEPVLSDITKAKSEKLKGALTHNLPIQLALAYDNKDTAKKSAKK